MRTTLALLSLLPLAMACTAETSSDESGDPTATSADDSTDPLTLDDSLTGEGLLVQATGGADAPFDPECVIDEDRIAGVRIPATLGDFAQSFPAPTALRFHPAFMVDFGAFCTMSAGEDAICAIFESYEVEDYSPAIEVVGMAVYAPQCRTGAGVGPGSDIATAVAAYGAASFGFNYGNEGREYVSFANAPQNYSFRADSPGSDAPPEGNWPGGRFGGDYTDVEGEGGEFFETQTARPGATIWEVWISSMQ